VTEDNLVHSLLRLLRPTQPPLLSGSVYRVCRPLYHSTFGNERL